MITETEEATIALPDEIIDALRLVDENLSGLSASEFMEDGLFAPSVHLIRAKGKMLRPALVFMGSLYAGHSDIKNLVDIAVAVELLHTSSLIHDDIIDKDIKRRGVESTHVRYGNELALLAGDALISSAIQRISGYGQRIISIMARTAMEMAAGEALDFRFQKSGTIPNVQECSRIADLKSASLIGTSASIAASYKAQEHEKALREFGRNFGMAFQIRDDVHDFIDGAEGSATVTRPNIVRSIMRSGVAEKEAVAKAVEMNNEHISRGLAALDKDKRGIFERYSGVAALGSEGIF